MTWREQHAAVPPEDDLVFLGWIEGDRFMTATNEGFWELFSECGYDWKPVWGRKQ